MDRKLCVYTCITGDYDNLHEIRSPEKGVDYYCFTNNKSLKSKTWKIIQIKNERLDNCRLARKIKILGHPEINDNYRVAVWTDADVVWQKSIVAFVKEYLDDSSTFTIFKHHARETVFEEAVACLVSRKDNKDIIMDTLDYFEKEGFPDKTGLFESTVFIKDLTCPKAKEMSEIWFGIVDKYSRRDQLSFPYAVWKTGLKVREINLNVWKNDWFYTLRHAKTVDSKNCHIYYGNEAKKFSFDNYHVLDYKEKDGLFLINDVVPIHTKKITINPTDRPGTCFSDIFVSPKPNSRLFQGGFSYKGKDVFCVGHDSIVLYGDFRQGQKLALRFRMYTPSKSEQEEFYQQAWFEKAELSDEIARLNIDLSKIRKDLADSQAMLNEVLNSKAWRAAEKLRKFIPKKVA